MAKIVKVKGGLRKTKSGKVTAVKAHVRNDKRTKKAYPISGLNVPVKGNKLLTDEKKIALLEKEIEHHEKSLRKIDDWSSNRGASATAPNCDTRGAHKGWLKEAKRKLSAIKRASKIESKPATKLKKEDAQNKKEIVARLRRQKAAEKNKRDSAKRSKKEEAYIEKVDMSGGGDYETQKAIRRKKIASKHSAAWKKIDKAGKESSYPDVPRPKRKARPSPVSGKRTLKKKSNKTVTKKVVKEAPMPKKLKGRGVRKRAPGFGR